jgi:hypothetical protein
MSFLQPYFLFGLIALVIPVIIHLFDFRRTKKVYFSNTRLLDQVKESTRSFYNLKHILILITRLLFITSLVLAFAQPFIVPSGQEGLTATRVGLFIDNSNSMSNRVGQDETGLSLAKETAIELIDLYPAGTEFMIQSAFEESSINLYLSKQTAIDKIEKLELVSNAYSLQNIIDRFNNGSGGRPPMDVLLISDFQKAVLMNEELQLDSQQNYILAPVMFESYQNIAVDSAYISNPFELDKTKTNLAVSIRNFSEEDHSGLAVKLFLGNRQLSVSTVDVAGGGTTLINFTVGQTGDDELGSVVVEDFPISFDNKLFFTLRSIDKVNITQVMGAESGQFIPAVFGNNSLFNLTTMQESNINYSNLETADIIIINAVDRLDASFALRLRNLNQNGTAVLIIPSKQPEVYSFQDILPQLSQEQIVENVIDLEVPDFARPFYQNILERQDANLQMPAARPVWSWGGDRNALLKFIDGRPFLSEIRPGFFIMASPLNSDYSTFQNNALFVPIMYRIAANSQQNIDPLYYRIDRNEISVRYDELDPNTVVRLKNEALEFLPDQRLTGTSIEMLLPGGIIPTGHYEVIAKEEKIKTIALNYKTDESDVLAANETELNQVFEGSRFNVVSGADAAEIVSKFSAEYKGIALWRYFLGLALVFLLIEALLIRLL